MSESHSYVVDISPDTTTVSVALQHTILLNVRGARAITLNGVPLQRISTIDSVWMWRPNNQHLHHIIWIDWGTHVQHIDVVLLHAADGQSIAQVLHQQLSSIDPVLCIGRNDWLIYTNPRDAFERFMEMSCKLLLQSFMRLIQGAERGNWDEWNGIPSSRIRFDYIDVQSHTPLPMQFSASHIKELTAEQRMNILAIIQFCDDLADVDLKSLIVQLRHLLHGPCAATSTLVLLVQKAEAALVHCRRSADIGVYMPTADVALLYERWVWLQVLYACGLTDTQVREAIHAGQSQAIEVLPRVWCGYQRRLLPTHAEDGWSRDGRVAIPDLLLWQEVGAQRFRAIVVDAKYSYTSASPSAQSYNDVTSYLRRVGMGSSDPDRAVLVHPGGANEDWPSGLSVIGTNNTDAAGLRIFIANWLRKI